MPKEKIGNGRWGPVLNLSGAAPCRRLFLTVLSAIDMRDDMRAWWKSKRVVIAVGDSDMSDTMNGRECLVTFGFLFDPAASFDGVLILNLVSLSVDACKMGQISSLGSPSPLLLLQ